MVARNDSQDYERRGANMPTTTGLRQEPLFATDTSCDVALIVEEVVDGTLLDIGDHILLISPVRSGHGPFSQSQNKHGF